MIPAVTISKRGEERIASGHPWIYRTDVADANAMGAPVVTVRTVTGRVLGQALFSDRSQITLRMLTRGAAVADRGWLHQRLDTAIRFRAALNIQASAYRLVHGEADLLPSLVVDRYGDYLVLQALSQGMDALTPQVVDVLNELVQPKGILARNDPRARVLEGLEQRIDVLSGDVPPLVHAHELGVHYDVDVWHGQKTGLFLDQRENRQAAAGYANGRLLDCFSYNGGFALALAARAREAIAFDISEDAVARITRNAERNHVKVDARVGNVFDELRGLERLRERFDTIVLDPPAFAKSRAAVPKAMTGYKEINLRALKLLSPGGTLVTCSCSHHIDESTFAGILHDAAVDAQVQVSIVEKRMQGRDHPVLLGVPESSYLKCFILRKLA